MTVGSIALGVFAATILLVLIAAPAAVSWADWRTRTTPKAERTANNSPQAAMEDSK